MKRLFGFFVPLIILICIHASANAQRFTAEIYNAHNEKTSIVYITVSDLRLKENNDDTFIVCDMAQTEISENILSTAKENENMIIMNFKSNDENNPYPEIESMSITVSCSGLIGGGRKLLGKDYRLIHFNGNSNEDLSAHITDSDLHNVRFTTDRLGRYVIYLNPSVYDVTFYSEEPIYDENGSITNLECIYTELKNLHSKDIVEFPPTPKKEGYVFTGWKNKTQSGTMYFSNSQPLYANYPYEYYASWCPIDEYEPINIEISSNESITKGKENGKKIILKTNYGIFADEEELTTSPEYWNIVGSDDIMIDTVTRIDDKTVEFTLSGNSNGIYKDSEIYIEFDNSLLLPEPYEIDGEIIDWDDTKVKIDEDGVRAKMYRSDNVIKLSKQSRLGGNAGLGVAKYTVSFESNDGSEVKKQTVAKNALTKEPEIPEKAGYVFAGWFMDEEFTNKYDFTEKVTENITLYAKWDIDDITKDQIIFTIGKTEASVFGEEKQNDVAPIIKSDRAYLPVRFVAENLGASVSWDDETKTITVTKDDIIIIFTIDAKNAIINGESIVLDYPAFIENDRTYTPIRFIAENLGSTVDWNPNNKIITITQ